MTPIALKRWFSKYDFVVFNGDCVDDPVDHEQATTFISELTEGVYGDRSLTIKIGSFF